MVTIEAGEETAVWAWHFAKIIIHNHLTEQHFPSPSYQPSGSEGREELVEVEWEGVELLAARVCLEGPEPVPEMVPPVLPHGAISPLQRIVQEIRHSPADERLRGEYHVDHIVEPSCTRVYRTKACDGSVLVEILWHRQTHKQREPQDEFCSEAVQVAELQETNTRRTNISEEKTVYSRDNRARN